MIVLDTNVISEVLRPQPDSKVSDWLAMQPLSALFTTAISQAEVFYAVTLLPEGRRRNDLMAATRPIFENDLSGRVLAFDADAAVSYADIATNRRRLGRPISQFDAQIAAIVHSRGATLATRNVRDFIDCGIAVIDPWAT